MAGRGPLGEAGARQLSCQCHPASCQGAKACRNGCCLVMVHSEGEVFSDMQQQATKRYALRAHERMLRLCGLGGLHRGHQGRPRTIARPGWPRRRPHRDPWWQGPGSPRRSAASAPAPAHSINQQHKPTTQTHVDHVVQAGLSRVYWKDRALCSTRTERHLGAFTGLYSEPLAQEPCPQPRAAAAAARPGPLGSRARAS